MLNLKLTNISLSNFYEENNFKPFFFKKNSFETCFSLGVNGVLGSKKLFTIFRFSRFFKSETLLIVWPRLKRTENIQKFDFDHGL